MSETMLLVNALYRYLTHNLEKPFYGPTLQALIRPLSQLSLELVSGYDFHEGPTGLCDSRQNNCPWAFLRQLIHQPMEVCSLSCDPVLLFLWQVLALSIKLYIESSVVIFDLFDVEGGYLAVGDLVRYLHELRHLLFHFNKLIMNNKQILFTCASFTQILDNNF